jgi:hypothetical protein
MGPSQAGPPKARVSVDDAVASEHPGMDPLPANAAREAHDSP